MKKIHKKTLILPHLIPLFLEFGDDYDTYTLSVTDKPSDVQFKKFIDTFVSSIGKKALHVVRMSDGEYLTLLGYCPPVARNTNFIHFMGKYFNYLRLKISNKNFEARTLPNVSSGQIPIEEKANYRKILINAIKYISSNGILALHLSYGPRPFQEKYHSRLNDLFKNEDILINENNYVPFYYIYGAFTHPNYEEILFKDKSILLINGADISKRQKIEATLFSKGVKKIDWIDISSKNSFSFKIKPKAVISGSYDYALMGAGLGKFNIFNQFRFANFPIVDVGVLFEYWSGEKDLRGRPFIF